MNGVITDVSFGLQSLFEATQAALTVRWNRLSSACTCAHAVAISRTPNSRATCSRSRYLATFPVTVIGKLFTKRT